jgi:uncharacterized lipoprotein YmbA
MRTRIVAALGIAGLALGPAGCVSLKRTPEAQFFVLRSLAEPPASPAGAAGQVGVLPVRLPGYLDRAQLVTEMDDHRLAIDEYARWAELLPPAVTRTVAENLAILLPETRVLQYPWRAHEPLRCRVAVDLRVLAPQGDGTVRLEGRFALLPEAEERPLVIRPVALRRGPLPVGKQGIASGPAVEAMSELLADLSLEIAAGVRALPADGVRK